MRSFLKSRLKSFEFAISGWSHVFKTQPNARIHALVTILVVILAGFLRLALKDWVALLIMICLVWCLEFINTAIEALVDLSSPKFHPLAKISKDVSAASVLIAAIFSIVIGLLILGPPLLEKLRGM